MNYKNTQTSFSTAAFLGDKGFCLVLPVKSPLLSPLQQ